MDTTNGIDTCSCACHSLSTHLRIAIAVVEMQSSGELENVRTKIEELEKEIKTSKDLAEKTAIFNLLAGLQQEKVLLLQGEKILGAWLDLAATLSCILIHLQGWVAAEEVAVVEVRYQVILA